MNKKEIELPKTLKQSISGKNTEEFLKPFGITKVFLYVEVYHRNIKKDLCHCYKADIFGNKIKNLESIGICEEHASIKVDNKTIISTHNIDSSGIKVCGEYLVLEASSYSRGKTCDISYFDEKNVFISKITFEHSSSVPGWFDSNEMTASELEKEIEDNLKNIDLYSFSKWKCQKKKLFALSATPIQRTEELDSILKHTYPYTYDFMKQDKEIKSSLTNAFLCCPHIEILAKAGFSGLYEIFKNISRRSRWNPQSDINKFNILIKEGNNPKEIIQMSPPLAKAMTECRDILKWDSFRKLEKTKTFTTELLIEYYEQNYDRVSMDKMGAILRRKYNGKNIFSTQSLINYLERLDQYEAIEREEALTLLTDYLRMCQQLKIKPKIDGDSLKREHDVCARMLRNKKLEEHAEGIEEHGKELLQYSYQKPNSVYNIRPIEDYDDLLEEANVQRNCVASYAPSIAKKTAHIFSLSKKGERYATVQLKITEDSFYISQAFAKYNSPISKDAQEFLNDWLEVIQKRVVNVA